MCCVLFVVLCIVCCVSQYCVVPTIKCKFFQQNVIFFHKNKFILCKLLMFFFASDIGLSISACSVRLMWSSLWWSRCIFGVVLEPLHRHSALAGLIRRSVGRWRLWACHATNHKIFIYQPIFTIFAAKNPAISAIKTLINFFIKLFGF